MEIILHFFSQFINDLLIIILLIILVNNLSILILYIYIYICIKLYEKLSTTKRMILEDSKNNFEEEI